MSESGHTTTGDQAADLDNEMEGYLRELDDRGRPDSHREGGASGSEDEPPRLYFGSVDEFVRGMVVPVFRRRVGDRSPYRWAADWWRYPEANLRLEAMWRAWENLRLDPATGMSVWLRDHADYHLNLLFSDYGPFGKSLDTSDLGEPLPYEAPPPGMFPDVRDQ